jgi:hypothetical protein
MIKYYHELKKEEFLWLVEEKTTYSEVEKDFPQPPWCSYHQATFGIMGCWSLTDWESGYSTVTGEDFCKTCDLYEYPLKRYK